MILRHSAIRSNYKDHIIFYIMSIVLVMNTISFQYIFFRDAITYVKLTVLLMAVLIFLVRPLVNNNFNIYIGFALLFLFSFIATGISLSNSLIALVGLCVPWCFFSVVLNDYRKIRLLYLIATCGIISIFFGIIFELFGYWDVVKNEYTGAVRLQGASIPAHFAFICFNGVVASSILLMKNKQYAVILFILNSLLVSLSGTRMALMLSVLLIVFLFLSGSIKITKNNSLIFILIFILFSVASYYYLPTVFERTFSDNANFNSDVGFNASGRIEAWIIYYDLAMEKFWFGSGLGSVTIPFENGVTHFGVPHNEYIRFFYEGGIIGLLVIIVFVYFFHRMVYIRAENEFKKLIPFLGVLFSVYCFTDNALSTIQFTIPYAIILSSLNRSEI